MRFERARLAAGVPAGRRYLLMLGRIHPIKRLDLLAGAFARVAHAVADVHLVIAGPDEGGHRAAVEPLFAASASRVHWCGAVEPSIKHGLLAGASALVACSDSESFGMSIAEALSAAVPVVVTHTCPWPVIAQADCGFWVAQSAEAIADGLSAILQQPDQARAKGARGQTLARREFSANAIGARWAAAYAECLAGDRRGPTAS